jgi:hypothetical protein
MYLGDQDTLAVRRRFHFRANGQTRDYGPEAPRDATFWHADHENLAQMPNPSMLVHPYLAVLAGLV